MEIMEMWYILKLCFEIYIILYWYINICFDIYKKRCWYIYIYIYILFVFVFLTTRFGNPDSSFFVTNFFSHIGFVFWVSSSGVAETVTEGPQETFAGIKNHQRARKETIYIYIYIYILLYRLHYIYIWKYIDIIYNIQ